MDRICAWHHTQLSGGSRQIAAVTRFCLPSWRLVQLLATSAARQDAAVRLGQCAAATTALKQLHCIIGNAAAAVLGGSPY
jgi:hypothetical protein